MYGYCQGCKKYYGKLHIHHLDKKHGAEKPEDTINLCPKCHNKEHEFDRSLDRDHFTVNLCSLISDNHYGDRVTWGFNMLNSDYT